jgi:hypothetical protein
MQQCFQPLPQSFSSSSLSFSNSLAAENAAYNPSFAACSESRFLYLQWSKIENDDEDENDWREWHGIEACALSDTGTDSFPIYSARYSIAAETPQGW